MAKNLSPKQQFNSDLAKVMALIDQTRQGIGQPHPFFEDVAAVMVAIEKAGAHPASQLALHLVSVAVAELLSHRGCSTKICLLAAYSLIDSELHAHVLDKLFPQVFQHQSEAPGIPDMVNIFGALMADPEKLDKMPYGHSTIEIGGQSAHIVKMQVGQGAPPPKSAKAKSKKSKKFSVKANPWN